MDMEQVLILANDRDRRTLEWLVAQVGEAAILDAVAQLAGARKPYLSNVAKVLGVELPKKLEQTPAPNARAHLADLKKMVGLR